jgi:ABC-type dipeptide/oligopeptide/nickel transport system permease subunit
MRAFEDKRVRKFFRDPVVRFVLAILGTFVALALLAPWLAPYDPMQLNMRARFQTPSPAHWLGTDEVGRDVLSRLLHGARVSLSVGFVSTGIAFGLGGTLGLLAAGYRRLDDVIMRLMDVLLAIPTVLLAIAIIAALGPGLYNLMIAVGLGSVPTFARLMRSSAIRLREIEYVDAARALGAHDLMILWRAVLPNALPPVLIFATLSLGGAILSAAILNFLGLGLDPTVPEWGAMAAAGRNYLRQAPHITFIPSIVIFVMVLCLNMLGDKLRDYLDPRGG